MPSIEHCSEILLPWPSLPPFSSYLDYINSFPAGLFAYVIPLKAILHTAARLTYLRQKSDLITSLQTILQ